MTITRAEAHSPANLNAAAALVETVLGGHVVHSKRYALAVDIIDVIVRRERLEATVTGVLAATREVNGGELESVLTIYTPAGLALLVVDAMRRGDLA